MEVYPELVKVDDIAKALINGISNRDFGAVTGGIGTNRNDGGKAGEAEDLEMKLKYSVCIFLPCYH